MKKLLFALLIMVSFAAHSQTQVSNPEEVTLSTTNVTRIDVYTYDTPVVSIWLLANESNVGTIKVNGLSPSMTKAATLSDEKYIIIQVSKYFHVQATNANDKFTYGVL